MDLTPPWSNRGMGDGHDGGAARDLQAGAERIAAQERFPSTDLVATEASAPNRDDDAGSEVEPDAPELIPDAESDPGARDGLRTAILDGSAEAEFEGLAQDATSEPPEASEAQSPEVADGGGDERAEVAKDTMSATPDLAPIDPEEPLPESGVLSRNGLKIWLRADRGFVKNAGGVAFWKSIVEAPAQAMADTPARSPSWLSASVAIGGKPGVLFDGSDDCLRIVPRPVQDDFTIIMVLSTISTLGSTDSCWWTSRGLLDGDVANRMFDFGMAIGSDGRIRVGVGTGFLLLADDCLTSSRPGLNDGSPHVAVFTRTKATGVFTIHTDGFLGGTATGTTASLSDPSRITVGALQAGMPDNPFAGLISEVLIYARALPLAERRAVEAYVGARYGFATAP